jgi:hypothetical protein
VEVKLGLLEQLYLSDINVLEGIHIATLSLDLLADRLGNEPLDEISELDLAGLSLHDLNHLGSDSLDLRSSSVAVALGGVGLTLAEGNSEHTEDVSISGLDFSLSLDKGLPLTDKGAELITSHVHTVEISKAVTSLSVEDLELDLSEALIGVLVEVTEVSLADTTEELLGSDLSTSGLGNKSLAGVPGGEHGGSLHVVPFLLKEDVTDLLLKTLLSLGKSLVFAHSHFSIEETSEIFSMDFPFSVDPLDHAESPAVAYSHVTHVLDTICKAIDKSRAELVIYDPYYCRGSVVGNLAELGFANVVNRNVDFYSSPLKQFDVIVTNPPYSGDHPDRLVEFCIFSGKPWLLLVPNWVYTKPYYIKCTTQLPQKPFYIAPKKRYTYSTPKGFREDDDGKTSPFVTFWFIHCGTLTNQAYSNCQGVEGIHLARETRSLPMTYLDQFDPEYKRQRNIMKSQKRKNKQPPKPSASWGHKVGVKK